MTKKNPQKIKSIKNTVLTLLKNNKNIELYISYTTRKKRTLEKNSKDYNFVSVKEFKKLKKKKYFIEWAKVFNNYYGTSLIKVKKIKRYLIYETR